MENDVNWYWNAVGVIGSIIFYGRFLAQWWVSERQKSSVVPPLFWYMSLPGSILLLLYGVRIRSPLGTLANSINLFIYARNIAFIWREKGWLEGLRDKAFHILFTGVTLTGLSLVVWTWYREYEVNQDLSVKESVTNWAWLVLGVAGQGLFALRMLVQWLASERAKKSVVPTVFWYLSVAAATMVMATFIQRGEWIFAAGIMVTLVIYLRNLWFIYFGESASETAE